MSQDMISRPLIFDRALLRQRRCRAVSGMDEVRYLLEHVANDIAERLCVMQRRFELALDLGAHGTVAGSLLTQTGKIDRLVRGAPIEALAGGGAWAMVCDEEALPFAPGRFDLVVSILGLQLVNDLPGALLQIRQCLKPDGLFLGALLGGNSLKALRDAFASAEADITGGASPRIAPFADVRDLGQLLQRAGFALPVADTERVDVTYASPLVLMQDLKRMGASNMLADRRKMPLRRSVLAAAMAAYPRDADGRITASFEIVTLTGWAPHASQKQPLQPGSGAVNLRTALRGT
jgi:SAM-dependent methyltransferase